MIQFDLRSVTIEGPDCAGKTTLYKGIHKRTNFKWNIQDRSTLSMLCYARMYGRDTAVWRRLLDEELRTINNAVIVLVPHADELLERLRVRGDDFQDETSIVKLLEIFEEETDKIKDYPNVKVVKTLPDPDEIVRWLQNREHLTYSDISRDIEAHADASLRQETVMLRALWLDSHFETLDETALHYEHEIEYYNETRRKFIKKINDELVGDNEYKKPQDLASRRFILTQDTCISYVHFVVRDGVIVCNSTIRSSECSQTFHRDIHFIADLARVFKNMLNLSPKIPVAFSLTLDSAHIVRSAVR